MRLWCGNEDEAVREQEHDGTMRGARKMLF